MRCPRSRLANGAPGGDGAPLPGTKTRRQELADGRGWSTYRKRGPYAVQRHRRGAPKGARASREGSAAYGKSVAPHRRATPSALSGVEGKGRLTRGRTNNTGDRACVARNGQARRAHGCLKVESIGRNASSNIAASCAGLPRASMISRSEANQYCCACGLASWIAGSSPAMTTRRIRGFNKRARRSRHLLAPEPR